MSEVKLMKKLSIRLAQSTKNDINDLKQILEDENHGDRQFTNGDVVNQAYRDIETFDDWEKVILEYKNNTQKGFIPKEEPELKTNLTISNDAYNGFQKIKAELSKYIKGRIYISFVIKMIVRASRLMRQNKLN
ncbi:hypothetical protein GYN24_05730 [Lactococcus piscium]|uniref:Uncharacterized protein n=2 Tax=Pseudolactococcus paracarnosus TaxID=2749962 RepID=A0A7L4WE56_9LACT|nr:hypothetical protein [Lactococcus paracarnosus]MCJ1994078.1 hypothetical protein [Lactococcus paracarnosus]QDJ27412.1 hypothetical protein BHS01_01990 [Lactococcus paracarnosus]